MKNTTYQKMAVVLLALIGLVLVPAVFAEEEKTVLDRVKIVDDPELGELVQIAINNLPQLKRIKEEQNQDKRCELEYEMEIAKAKTIRIVTEIYAQIKLLDEKIKQINIRIDESKTTKNIESELLLAKSTLEAERLTKIAQLRETLNWTPWTSFGTKEVRDLNVWIHLDVIDDTVRIMEFRRPLYTWLYDNKFSFISFLSPDDTIKYLESLFNRPDTKPVRITMYATRQGTALANELRERIKLTAKNAKADFQTDLASNSNIIENKRFWVRVLKEGNKLQAENNLYDVKSYDDYVKFLLQRPGAIPSIYAITYEDVSLKDKAKELEDALNAVIKELGYTKYVKVENKGPSDN